MTLLVSRLSRRLVAAWRTDGAGLVLARAVSLSCSLRSEASPVPVLSLPLLGVVLFWFGVGAGKLGGGGHGAQKAMGGQIVM